MKTLHLNLIKKWFDLIYKRIKPEEYRDITPYFCQKFLLYCGESKERLFWQIFSDVESILAGIRLDVITFKQISSITFSNGYSKTRPQFKIRLKNIKIDEGKEEWGAGPNKEYFVLQLGKILNR
jgi:hypothetical protein